MSSYGAIIPCAKIPIFDKITDNIFLGDIVAASDSDLMKSIDIIISLIDTQIKHSNIEYFIFPIEDNRDVQIDLLFEKTNDIIKKAIENNKKILIHCHNGVSRSVTILLAYFISKSFTLKESLNIIKNNRISKQYTRPNFGFMKQLIVYEKEILGTNSLTLKEFINC